MRVEYRGELTCAGEIGLEVDIGKMPNFRGEG